MEILNGVGGGGQRGTDTEEGEWGDSQWLEVYQTFERRAVNERTQHLPGFQSMALSIGPDI